MRKQLTERLDHGQSVTPDDGAWLSELAVRYKVLESTSEPLNSNAFVELLMRVDIIPPSLALAQAASESGWGTSRFAAQGNALFGQWIWGKGLKPTKQRTSEFGDQRIAAFASTSQAAYAYALNLNTEHAYREPSPQARRTAVAKAAHLGNRPRRNVAPLLRARASLRQRS